MTGVHLVMAGYGGSASSIEDELTLTQTIAPNNTISSKTTTGAPAANEITAVQNGVLACDMNFAASYPGDGCIWEIGGTGDGAFVGFQVVGGTQYLVYRAGNGGAATGTSHTNKAELLIPYSSIAGQVGTLGWEWNIAADTIRIWLDGTLLGSATAASGLPSRIAGGNVGTFNATSSNPPQGCPANAAAGITSDLRYYYNQLVSS